MEGKPRKERARCARKRESALCNAIVVAVVAGSVSFAQGEEPDPSPSPLPLKRAVALGYAGSSLDLDVSGGDEGDLTPGGLGVLGRADLHEHWGLQLGYSQKDEGLAGGGELDVSQLGVHAYYAWEGLSEGTSPYRLRAYPKAGLALTDIEARVPASGTLSDDAFGPSIGLGLEYGGRRWGIVFDAAWTFVDVELTPGQQESLTVGAGFFGLVYCF